MLQIIENAKHSTNMWHENLASPIYRAVSQTLNQIISYSSIGMEIMQNVWVPTNREKLASQPTEWITNWHGRHECLSLASMTSRSWMLLTSSRQCLIEHQGINNRCANIFFPRSILKKIGTCLEIHYVNLLRVLPYLRRCSLSFPLVHIKTQSCTLNGPLRVLSKQSNH